MSLTSKVPLWLDCDPGLIQYMDSFPAFDVDADYSKDAYAILLAAYHPALHLMGISTVHGNAPLVKTTNNALSILEAIGKSGMTVHPGASKPFCRQVVHAPDIHGESGLDGTDLLPDPSTRPLLHCNAIQDMRDALMACPPDSAWLVTTGTLTNAALLFATFPEVANHIKGLSIMGGAVGGGFTAVPLGPSFVNNAGQKQARIGNYTPFAEFNIWADPESAQSIFGNPSLAAKTTLVPLDLTHQAFVNKDVQQLMLQSKDLADSPTRMRRMFNELLMFFAQTYSDVFELREGPPLHDPIAVAVLLASSGSSEQKIAFNDDQGERWEISVVLEGEQTGRTVLKPATGQNGVIVPRSFDLQNFWKAMEQCLASADAATGYIR